MAMFSKGDPDKWNTDITNPANRPKAKPHVKALLSLAEGQQGEATLDLLVDELLKGIPLSVAVRGLSISAAELDALRRVPTPWGERVNNTIVATEAQWATWVMTQLTTCKDKVQLDGLRLYLDVLKPGFAKEHRMRLEYECNIILDVVKRWVTEDVWEKIVADMAELVNPDAVAAFDERLLPDTRRNVSGGVP